MIKIKYKMHSKFFNDKYEFVRGAEKKQTVKSF